MTEPNISFDDVLDMVMLEEQQPSRAALSRWAKRYPQFRGELTEYFNNWAVQVGLAAADPAPEINEDWFADLGSAFARQVLRRQDAKIADDAIVPLNSFERLIYTAVRRIGSPRDCYAEKIEEKVHELAAREVSGSSILETLKSLESRYVVFSWSPDPAKYPDEANRTYFFITPMGERSMEKANKT